MLKEYSTVHNAIITLGDTDDSGKGRHFKSRFIQPGLVNIEKWGTVLIRKETLDESLKSMIGTPVIIQHRNVTDDNADDLRVGINSEAFYNISDGWYYATGVMWNKTAQNLVTDQNWSVSCSYDIIEVDTTGGIENNIKFDAEFTKLNFKHLALVNNPRYERANIVFNSKDNFAEQFTDIFFEALAEVIVENSKKNNGEDKPKFVTVGKGKNAHPIPVEWLQKAKGFQSHKKSAAWDILSIATGKNKKWLKMQYRKSNEFILNLLEKTDDKLELGLLDDSIAEIYPELHQLSYQNAGTDTVGVGSEIAHRVYEDLLNDNFYEEDADEQGNERAKYELEQDIKTLKSKIQSQYVKDLIKEEEIVSEKLYLKVIEEIDKNADTKKGQILMNDLDTLEKLEKLQKYL